MKKINVIDRGDAIAMYLDWFNNFLSIPRFAEYYGISESLAHEVICFGREVLNNQLYRTNKVAVSVYDGVSMRITI